MWEYKSPSSGGLLVDASFTKGECTGFTAWSDFRCEVTLYPSSILGGVCGSGILGGRGVGLVCETVVGVTDDVRMGVADDAQVGVAGARMGVVGRDKFSVS